MNDEKRRIIIFIGIILLIVCVIKGVLYTIEYDEYLRRPKELFESLRLEDIESVTCKTRYYDYHDEIYRDGNFQLSEDEINEMMILLQDIEVGKLIRDVSGYAYSRTSVLIRKADGTIFEINFGSTIILNNVPYRCEDEPCNRVKEYLNDRARAHHKSNTEN